LRDFIFAELYTDLNPENRVIQNERFGSVALPLYVILGPDGKERVRLAGQIGMVEFLEFLKKGQASTGMK
jgi:hypothetical protein